MQRAAMAIGLFAAAAMGCSGGGAYYNTAEPGVGAYTVTAPPVGGEPGVQTAGGIMMDDVAPPPAPYHRSPFLAGFLSIIPGFGCGHFYAGEPKTGGVLLGLEAVGMAMGAYVLVRGAVELALMVVTVGLYQPQDWGDLSKTAVAGIVLAGGCVLFDLFHSPAVVIRKNRRSAGWSGAIGPMGAALRYEF